MRKLDFCRALPLSPAASLDLGEHLPRIFSFRDDAVCGAKCGANLVGRDFVKQGGQIRPNQTSHPRPSNPHSPRHRFPLPMRGFSLYGASFVKGGGCATHVFVVRQFMARKPRPLAVLRRTREATLKPVAMTDSTRRCGFRARSSREGHIFALPAIAAGGAARTSDRYRHEPGRLPLRHHAGEAHRGQYGVSSGLA